MFAAYFSSSFKTICSIEGYAYFGGIAFDTFSLGRVTEILNSDLVLISFFSFS